MVHVGDDPFNLHLMLFQMVTRPARLKIIGEAASSLWTVADPSFLPLLGAPDQRGSRTGRLARRLESSAVLPSDVAVPAGNCPPTRWKPCSWPRQDGER